MAKKSRIVAKDYSYAGIEPNSESSMITTFRSQFHTVSVGDTVALFRDRGWKYTAPLVAIESHVKFGVFYWLRRADGRYERHGDDNVVIVPQITPTKCASFDA